MNKDSVKGKSSTILTYHRIVEAFKFAYAKRSQLGDEDFVDVSEVRLHFTPRIEIKTVQNSFCLNFVKFAPSSINFCTMVAKGIKLCEVHLFSVSTNSHQRTTVLKAVLPHR